MFGKVVISYMRLAAFDSMQVRFVRGALVSGMNRCRCTIPYTAAAWSRGLILVK